MTFQMFMLGERPMNDRPADRDRERKRIAAFERHMARCERCRVAKVFMERKLPVPVAR